MAQALTCSRCGRKWVVSDAPSASEVACPNCGLRHPTPPSPAALSTAARGAARTPPALPSEDAAHASASGFGAGASLIVGKKTSMEFHDLIDMTAMVDVVFFLLIFFLVTSLNALQASISVPTPDPQQSTAKASPTVAQFEKDGDFVVVRVDQDDTIWVEDAAIPSQQDLIVRLRDMRDGSGGDARGVLMLGHEDCSHGVVVSVLDAAAEAGMQDIRTALDNSDGQ